MKLSYAQLDSCAKGAGMEFYANAVYEAIRENL